LKVVIATTTRYEHLNEVRTKLALKTIDAANKNGFEIIVIDASEKSAIRDIFREQGARVYEQTVLGMGAGRRIAIKKAVDLAGPDGSVVWMEPEKYPFVPFISSLLLHMKKADIIVPARKSLKSYPVDQQHFEWLGNYLFEKLTGKALDVWFGPRIFRCDAARFFLNYDKKYGDKWESIFIPILQAIKEEARVIRVEVDYTHPIEQTRAEEGNIVMFDKRRHQLNILVEAMEKYSMDFGLTDKL